MLFLRSIKRFRHGSHYIWSIWLWWRNKQWWYSQRLRLPAKALFSRVRPIENWWGAYVLKCRMILYWRVSNFGSSFILFNLQLKRNAMVWGLILKLFRTRKSLITIRCLLEWIEDVLMFYFICSVASLCLYSAIPIYSLLFLWLSANEHN